MKTIFLISVLLASNSSTTIETPAAVAGDDDLALMEEKAELSRKLALLDERLETEKWSLKRATQAETNAKELYRRARRLRYPTYVLGRYDAQVEVCSRVVASRKDRIRALEVEQKPILDRLNQLRMVPILGSPSR